ncbi:endonuclease III [Microdochium nivale]|nr:endonuclease III [Microdochium nivale]
MRQTFPLLPLSSSSSSPASSSLPPSLLRNTTTLIAIATAAAAALCRCRLPLVAASWPALPRARPPPSVVGRPNLPLRRNTYTRRQSQSRSHHSQGESSRFQQYPPHEQQHHHQWPRIDNTTTTAIIANAMARATRAAKGAGDVVSSTPVKTKAALAPEGRRRSARVVKVEEDAPEVEEQESGSNLPATKTTNGRKKRAAAAMTTDADEDKQQATPKRGKRIKTEPADGDEHVSLAAIKPETPSPARKPARASRGRKVKSEGGTAVKKEEEAEDEDGKDEVKPSASPGKSGSAAAVISPSKAEALQARKLKSYSQYANKSSPFPDFDRPTPEECKLAHKILASIHGPRERAKQEDLKAPSNRAGCGDSPTVLDALVRTILSQNTSDKNSTRAKLSMDDVYGGSDRWDDIAAGGEAKLQKAIQCGGLSVVKSRVIISILRQCRERYGKYSLDHLFDASNDEAMTEMLSFQGVGPKTASCVLLFCLRRESFAVDTHVHRITGLLGWRPPGSSREEAHAHLDALVPDEDKYGLHILLVTHGKKCDECKAGGRSAGKCELRRAFRGAKLKGEAGEAIKEEEEEKAQVKEEGEEEDD